VFKNNLLSDKRKHQCALDLRMCCFPVGSNFNCIRREAVARSRPLDLSREPTLTYIWCNIYLIIYLGVTYLTDHMTKITAWATPRTPGNMYECSQTSHSRWLSQWKLLHSNVLACNRLDLCPLDELFKLKMRSRLDHLHRCRPEVCRRVEPGRSWNMTDMPCLTTNCEGGVGQG
jgi:hypothetical protein